MNSDDPTVPLSHDPLHGNRPSDLLRSAMGQPPPSPSPSSWQPPAVEELSRILPGYTISRLLGRGGMGAVYQGVQLSLNRDVAIKLLPPELGSTPEFEARFKREANAMARLNHPNIVQIYDYGQTAEGHHYIVMEYVDGMDLHHLIRSGGLNAIGALNAVSQICDALEYAHAEGFIHRDIKPANIFINHKGILKIGDFGLAKLVDSEAQTNDSDPARTRTEVVMGTLNYIAPEQWTANSKVDHRADIYSLGVMFYEMLTGTIPRGAFRAPSERVKTLDVRIDGVVFKAMESDPAERYQSAADLRTDVDLIRTTPDAKPPAKEPAGKPASTAKRKVPLGAVAMILVLLGSGIGLMVVRPWEEVQPSRSVEASAPRALPPSGAVPAATKESPFVNTLGMKFVPVPGTEILMCVHETRKGDYAAFANETQNGNIAWQTTDVLGVPIGMTNDHPVICVSWPDAKAFCTWLSQKEGRVYRLPTDWEWSHAVGVGKVEPPGVTPASLDARLTSPVEIGAENLFDISCKERFPNRPLSLNSLINDGFPTTAPVMSFRPNSLGIYDLKGNVWEYCEDFYDERRASHVIRGNCWSDPVSNWSTRGGGRDPFTRHNVDGFRCVLVPSGSTAVTMRVDLPVPTHQAVGAPQRYGLSRYQFFSGSLDWTEARGVAERLGGHLATLTSKAESDWVKATFGKHLAAPNQFFWLGGYALQPGQAWRWVTEESFIQSDWLSGDPKGSRNREGKAGPPFFLCLSQALDETKGWTVRDAEPAGSGNVAGFLVEWDDPFGDPPRLATTAPPAEPFTNSLGMKFVPVPGTRILLCIHETRKADYAAYARETEGVDGSWSNPSFQGVPVSTEDNHPVVMVNWFESRAFCDWLSRKEGRNYRLPTDREWSVAVGIGDREAASGTPESLSQGITDHWPWGTSQPVPSGAGNYADSTLKAKLPLQNTIKDYTDGFAVTAPVMRFPPNSLGLFDLGGNMAEWCEDGLNKEHWQRVLRGGSWFDGGPPYSSVRFRDLPGSRRFYFGFRCAVEVGDRGNGAAQ